MKARTLSLIGKGIALAMIVSTWFYRTFIIQEAGGAEILVYTGGVLGLFVDVAANLIVEKVKGKPAEIPPAPAGA